MSLAKDLLQQARHLAQKEPKKPRQASLRRAVSDAYYALFHLLIDACCRQLVTSANTQALRDQMARAFVHTDMQKASKAFASAHLPLAVKAILPGTISPDIQIISAIFVELQDARHEADYNVAKRFSRREALNFIQQSELAFQTWATDRGTHDGRVYLVSLLLWKQWAR